MKKRAAAIAIAALTTGAAATLPLPARAAAAADVRQVGRLTSPMIPARRHLDVDANARRLLEIGQRRGRRGMSVSLTDLDTLRAVGSVDVPGAQSGLGGSLSAVDELRHRLYVLYPVAHADESALRNLLGDETSQGTIDQAARTTFGIAVVDTLRARLLGTGAVTLLQPSPPQDRSESNGIGIKAMTFHRESGRDVLYLASEAAAGTGNAVASTHIVALHRVDVERLLDDEVAQSAVDWTYVVPQCALVMARDLPGVLFRSASTRALTLPCRQGGAQGLVAGQPGETPGVVQVTLADDVARFSSAFYPTSGNFQYGMVAVDPLSERLFLQIDGSSTEAGVWVFDVRTASYAGLTALPRGYSQGGTAALLTDVARGRLYAISTPDPDTLRSSVALASTDRETADQGEVRTVRIAPTPVKRRGALDPVAHRIFLPADESSIVVLEDTIPAHGRTQDADPDRNTLDVAEGERAAANFVGGAQAYGARLRWVGGIGATERNTNTVMESPPSELNPNTGGLTPPPPASGTRDLHFARVFHSTLSNGESSARATGAERDLDNTDADLSGFFDYVRGWGGPDLSSQRWPYATVDCADFGGREDKRDGSANGARATCRIAERRTSAVAVDESLSHASVVRVKEARARTAVARDARRGVVAIAEAESLGVEIGGVAGIGRVATRAETWATGRPKTSNGVGSGSSFTRTFEDVWVVSGGARRVVCAAQCDPQVVRGAINAALGARVRVELPMPDPERSKGTPGGFEALVVRNPFERANETSVNQESDERRLEVPGIVVTAFADGRVPSRVVVTLAGVSAESHYGIYLVSQSESFRPPRVRAGGGRARVDAPGGAAPDRVAPGVTAPITRFLRRTFAGLAFAVSSPGRALRTGALLSLLAAPLVMLSRRRRLEDP